MDDNQPTTDQAPIESVETTRKVIMTPTGIPILTGGTRETATVYPDGGHRVEKTEIRVATLDGHVVDHDRGDTAHQCPCCTTGPYSRHAMTTCTVCQRFVCRACTVPEPGGMLCIACHKEAKKQAFRRFFLSIR